MMMMMVMAALVYRDQTEGEIVECLWTYSMKTYSPNHNPEYQPSEAKDGNKRRGSVSGYSLHGQQRTQKYGQETRLQNLRLPAW